MAPGSGKRKRPERQFSHENGSGRPSPYQPEKTSLAQHNDNQRGRRGGRGGGNYRGQNRQGNDRSPSRSNNASSSVAHQSPALAPNGSNEPETSRSNTPLPSQIPSQSARPTVTAEPKGPPAPYSYDYVTDGIVESWKESGKQEISETFKGLDEFDTSILLQELVRSSIDERLDATEAGVVVRQMIAERSDENGLDVTSLFLNTISLLDESDMKDPALFSMVAATDIDPDQVRNELDVPLLQALSIVRSSFGQMRTRKTTNLLYRQANFNLLREETEGYAKLLTEYFNTAQQVSANRDANPDMAEDAFQRVKALVGAFDLDIGRVLDITLDISANLLVKAYGFFMKFYRCSSWWPDNGVIDNVKWEDQGFSSFPAWALPGSGKIAPTDDEREELAVLKQNRDVKFWERVQEVGMDAFYEIGARKIVDYDSVAELLHSEVEPQLDARGKEVNEDKRKRINENRKFMRETRLLPPPGNPDAAQLLGFKLRFYASSVRTEHDTLPENLVALAALLIKIGLISLRDLYPHLYPADERMAEEKTRLEKEKAEKEAKDRPGGGLNALAMAAALPDDTAQPVRPIRVDKERSGGTTPRPDAKDEDQKEQLPNPENQKIMLLRALLLIGAIPEALYILGRFPWLADADVSIAPHLLRLVKHMLSKMADSVKPLRDREDLENPRDQLADTVSGANGSMLFTSRPTRKSVRWLGLDKVDEDAGGQFTFYYTDWADNVPVCQSVDDVFLLCNTFIGYLGVKIGREPMILGTLVRLAKQSLSEDFSETNRTRWLELMRRLIVPALSLSKHNPGLTHEMYELLMFFPMTTRYNMYAEWFTGKTSRLPDMRLAFAYNKAEVKDVLRRVTNETGKKQARALAKVSYSSPGIVMAFMIGQLEAYNNMIPALVECTRYFPLLAYDVLTWSLINSLSGGDRQRTQADGMLTSPWLQALSNFVASLFTRYSILNPSPILQHLAFKIRSGNATDLEVFEQIFAEMAGIKPDMQFSDAQVQAMAGGENLQSLIVQQLADMRHARKTSAKRLIKALADPGLIGELLIAIAQEKQMYPHRENAQLMPLKVLTNNLDKIHQVAAQYLDVLKSNMKPEEFETAVPEVTSLIGDYGLEFSSAFTICRTAIAHRITEFDEAKKQEDLENKRRKASNDNPPVGGDVEMQDTESKLEATTDGNVPKSAASGEPQNSENEEAVITTTQTPTPKAPGNAKSPWHPVLEPIIQALPTVTGDLSERVSIPFFVTFWTLSQSDIVVFTESYTQEIDKLSRQMSLMTAERGESTAVARERERKKKALQETSESLRNEVTSRVAVYTKITTRLSREKHSWFVKPTDREQLSASHIALLQECFLPRAMMSSLDAHFSFLMFKLLHDKGTPGFNTMNFLSHLFQKHTLAAIMFQCTAQEAQHFGRFLNEILKLLARWHADKATYEKEAIGTRTKLPGFSQPFAAEGATDAFLDYEVFRRLLTNWHSALNAAVHACFESGEYSHTRSSIFVLRAVCQVFPALNYQGKSILAHVTRLAQEETRQDLQIMAKSLLGPLMGREKKWVMPQAFRLNDPSKDGKPGSRANSAIPEGSQQGPGTPKLNAAAAPFKPSGAVNGSEGAGIEDGEVEDENQATLKAEDVEMTAITDGPVATIESEDVSVKQNDKAAPTGPRASANGNDQKKQSGRPAKVPPREKGTTHPVPARPDARGPPRSAPAGPSRPPGPPGRYPNRPDDQYGRLDRPASRDHSPGHRNSRGGPQRDERDDRGQHRGQRDDAWAHPRHDPRGPAHSGPPIRGSQPNDRSNAPADGAAMSSSHSERSGQLQSAISGPAAPSGEGAYRENPARLAKINGEGSERGPRPSAPFPPTSDSRASDRGRGLEAGNDAPRDLTPKGPRNGRFNREPTRDMPPPSSESSYGRLNGPQEGTPIGSRPPNAGPGGRSRNFTPGQNQRDDMPGSASRLPESPAATRGHGSRQSIDRRSGPVNSEPSTPSTEAAPIPGMHPSRAAAFGKQPSALQTNVASNAPRNVDSPTSAAPSGPRNTRTPLSSGPAPGGNGPPVGPAGQKRDERGRRNISAINATLQGNNAPTGPMSFRGASTRQGNMPVSASPSSGPVPTVASSMEAPADRAERVHPRQDMRLDPRDDSKPDLFNGMDSNRPRRREDERQRGSRNASRDGRGGDESHHRGIPPGPNDEGRRRRGDEREDRRTRDDRDDRDNREGGPPHDRRGGHERQHRNDDMMQHPPRRGPPPPPPNDMAGGYAGSRSDWEQGQRGGHPAEDFRHAGRGMGRGGGPEYRGSRRGDDRRDAGAHGPPPPPPPPQAGPPPSADRKRRHEDPQFDGAKRRRSGK